jgi:hypothetical protein
MDFRSQLSAFQSGGGGGSDRSPQRPSNSRGYNTTSNNNSSNSHQGRGGGGGGDRGGDRRRPRDWSPHHYQQGRGGGGPPPHSRRRFQSPDRDGLGDLRHHGYKLPRGLPTPPTAEEIKQKPKHLALLMICIEDLPFEHIWKEFCQTLQASEGGNDEYHISLLCHVKYPKQVQSDWLKQRLLVYPPKSGRGNSYLDPEYQTRTPNWGSVEITRAMLDLLHTGLKIGHDSEKDMRFSSGRFLVRRPPAADGEEKAPPIPEVDQFLYISETCLPVATAGECFAAMDNAVSWVNAHHRKDPGTPKNAYENDQFGMINRRIPGQYRWKADQWALLCRKHASQIIGMDRPHIPHKFHLWHSYREINASDEMYIPTSLALLGLLRFTAEGEDTQRLRAIVNTDGNKGDSNPGSTPTPPTTTTPIDPSSTFEFVKKRPVTYTDWTEGMRNPATFAKGIGDFQKVARLARDKGCLVARKFAPYVALPGVSKKDLEVTGQISVEEWKREIELLAAEHKEKAASKEEASPAVAPATDPPKAADTKNEDEDEPEEESFLGTGGSASAANTKEEESDDGEEEEDDGENQLE